TTLLDFTDPDYTLTSTLTGGGETLSYDNPLDERTVPVNWATWGSPPATETATPRVGYTDGLSTLTISLSKPASTFGFEIEPDAPAAEETTADFYSGSKRAGVIDLFPNGTSGALLFAASTSTNPFTSVVITNLAPDDFAIARQRFTLASASTVPEPSSLFLLGSSLLGAVAFLRRSRKRS
ncbi:MAG: PEP-CTERM sorting domain-containing protein, partial [Acidobacteriota bacterium]|nr:PEP-CTERM sorting domain-containing protein [Acidobacteriota bacterium]